MSDPNKFIIQNDLNKLKKYLEDGGNPNKREKEWPNSTLLVDAVMQDNLEMISLLLDHINKKKLNPNYPSGDGKKPLEIIEYKLDRYPNENTKAIHTMITQAIELYKIKQIMKFEHSHKSRGFSELGEGIQMKIASHIRASKKKSKRKKSKRKKSKRKKSKR